MLMDESYPARSGDGLKLPVAPGGPATGWSTVEAEACGAGAAHVCEMQMSSEACKTFILGVQKQKISNSELKLIARRS